MSANGKRNAEENEDCFTDYIVEEDMAASLTRVTPEQRDLPLIEVATKSVACDGGGGALGHPLTYYEIGAESFATCGYCGKKFVLKN